MPQETLRVIATGIAKPGCLEAIRQLLRPLIETTRGQSGCLRYELWFSSSEADEFVLYQEWESEADLVAHIASPETEELGYRIGDLVTGPPDVRRYRLII